MPLQSIFNIYSKSFKFLKFPSKQSLYFVSSEYYASPILLFLLLFWTYCIGSAHPKPSKEIMVVTSEQDSVSWSFPRTHPSGETCCPLSSGCFLFSTPTSASHAFPGCGIHSVGSLGTLSRSERPQMLPLLGVGVLGKHQRVSAFLRAIRSKGHILPKRSPPQDMLEVLLQATTVKGHRSTIPPAPRDGRRETKQGTLRGWLGAEKS